MIEESFVENDGLFSPLIKYATFRAVSTGADFNCAVGGLRQTIDVLIKGEEKQLNYTSKEFIHH